jgi:ribosomal-protein-alanine N-acetyltransferase
MADLDRIVEIAQVSFSSPWTRKMFEAELSGNPFASLVKARLRGGGVNREDPAAIVGYLCYWVVFEELRLMDLAVDPVARRRGVARSLVNHALRSALASGSIKAMLEVRASNQPAQALYEQFGFRCITRRASYYSHPTEDAVLMELSPLAPS